MSEIPSGEICPKCRSEQVKRDADLAFRRYSCGSWESQSGFFSNTPICDLKCELNAEKAITDVICARIGVPSCEDRKEEALKLLVRLLNNRKEIGDKLTKHKAVAMESMEALHLIRAEIAPLADQIICPPDNTFRRQVNVIDSLLDKFSQLNLES